MSDMGIYHQLRSHSLLLGSPDGELIPVWEPAPMPAQMMTASVFEADINALLAE